ncbi:MAG: putative DNA modification/repair radical SAM protein [Clostridia bacterium]|nr:putative DNA modification/repair radical SAM protein [Clostridia bacterium]
MIDEKRLKILTEGAKYDVSCSSSGSNRQNKNGGIGNAHYAGICHSFTQDGRCISLLKILMSNDCIYNCKYCVNRAENDVPRATATPDEICELVIAFYKRNYIEGLFLSSAVVKSPNYTMEMLYLTALKLRVEYHFNGYIHLKGIPNADKALIEAAGRVADRMSFNIELPSEQSLKLLAPQKSKAAILSPMKMLTSERYFDTPFKRKNDFLPAGQTTQMIIGASPESDASILKLTEGLYSIYKLKRVYYSSYIPTNFDTSLLPVKATPKMREHRLYQADWLLRFYGFTADEITEEGGNLPLDCDPKCAWALRHLNLFPVEVNTAPLDVLLRVPGIGVNSANRIIAARKYAKLDFDALKRLRVVLKRAAHFITANGKFIGCKNENAVSGLLTGGAENYVQPSFLETETALSALTGQL